MMYVAKVNIFVNVVNEINLVNKKFVIVMKIENF